MNFSDSIKKNKITVAFIRHKRIEAENLLEQRRLKAENLLEQRRIESENLLEEQSIEAKDLRTELIVEAERMLEVAVDESENLINKAVGEAKDILEGCSVHLKKMKLEGIIKIEHIKQSAEIEIQNMKRSTDSVIRNMKKLEDVEHENLKYMASVEKNNLKRIALVHAKSLDEISQTISRNTKITAYFQPEMLNDVVQLYSENLKNTAMIDYEKRKENAQIENEKLKHSAKINSDKILARAKVFSENIRHTAHIESEKLLSFSKAVSSEIIKDTNEWKYQKQTSLPQTRSKKQHVGIPALLAIVAVFGTGIGVFYFTTTVDFSQSEDTLLTKYIVQNLRGDTVDTWHAWKKADGVPLTIHLMNSKHVTDERVGIIQNVIMSEEKIVIDGSILHNGPEGTTSIYYAGWTGALNSMGNDTRFNIPKDLRFQIDDDPTGDIVIRLTDTSNPERYSGFTRSIIDEVNHQVLKSEITIYNIDKISSDHLEILVRHELGHALGLAHSTDPADLMAPIITTGYPYISECVVDAIKFLYDGGKSSQVVCEK